MKFYFAAILAVILLSFSTSCSFFKPYEVKNETAHFDAYHWNAKKQEFLQEYKLRLTKIGNELRDLRVPHRSKIKWYEATSLLHNAHDELKSLNYIGVRDWDKERDHFMQTLNELDKKYESVRQL